MKEKFGDWLMDIAKYIVTVVLLTSFFDEVHEGKSVYVSGGIISIVLVIWGLYLQKETVRKKRRK